MEGSDKGTNFVTLGSTMPQNNTVGNHKHSFIDAAPLSVNSNYRIKSTSLNGEVEYSNIL
jgi:hypothetical protein